MRVTAVRKGYFGGKIRDAGEGFDLPDALMGDEKRRPSWVEAAGAGAVPAEAEGETASRKRVRKAKQPSPSVAADPPPDLDEDADTPTGNGLTEALGGPPPDWLPGDIND